MKKLLLSVFLGAALLLSPAAFAHEFIIKPSKPGPYKKGDTVALEILSTHYFMAGEELEPAEYLSAYALQDGKKTDLEFVPNNNKIVYETGYKLTSNNPAVIIGHRKGMLYSTTTKGGQDGDRKTLETKGFTVQKTTNYEKFSKTYLNPSASDKSFATPIGQPLEIVPVTNPADIAKGKPAAFKVLYEGKPLQTPVAATYDGYDVKTEEAYAVKTNSGVDGMVTVTPEQAGTWMLRVANTVPGDGKNYDEHAIRAVIVFNVK